MEIIKRRGRKGELFTIFSHDNTHVHLLCLFLTKTRDFFFGAIHTSSAGLPWTGWIVASRQIPLTGDDCIFFLEFSFSGTVREYLIHIRIARQRGYLNGYRDTRQLHLDVTNKCLNRSPAERKKLMRIIYVTRDSNAKGDKAH